MAFDPNMELVLTVVQATIDRLAQQPEDEGAWSELRAARDAAKDEDPDLDAAIELQDADELRSLMEQWMTDKRHLLVPDREVLKRAMKAFRKSLKVTRLDAESKLGGSPMTKGQESDIVGIVPPERYPRPVWDELVRQKRLVADRWGTYELPPGG